MKTSTEKQSLLQELQKTYIASMESESRRIDYDRISSEKLLIIEAFNDWSGRALAECGPFNLTSGGDDPCCATDHELRELVNKMVAESGILYPISSFSLNEKDELRYDRCDALYRLTSHTTGSRAHAISIAEAKHIQNSEAALNLWAFCATEDSVAYLKYQMGDQGLWLDDDEFEVVRRMVCSALLGRMSIGRVRNAIWRTVKDAASLSLKQYQNSNKASRTIPKKLDKRILDMTSDAASISYDRIAQVPLSAVLTLLLTRFGIDDTMSGDQVKSIFAKSQAESPKEDTEEDDIQNEINNGSFYFLNHFTDFDRSLLKCFDGIDLECTEPNWDQDHKIGSIPYSCKDYYCLNGNKFRDIIFNALNIEMFTRDEYEAELEVEEDPNAFGIFSRIAARLYIKSMIQSGLSEKIAKSLKTLFIYPASPSDIANVVPLLSIEAGIYAARIDCSNDCGNSTTLSVGDLNLSFQEIEFEPVGKDIDVILSIVNSDDDRLAELIAHAIKRKVTSSLTQSAEDLIKRVGQKLLENV